MEITKIAKLTLFEHGYAVRFIKGSHIIYAEGKEDSFLVSYRKLRGVTPYAKIKKHRQTKPIHQFLWVGDNPWNGEIFCDYRVVTWTYLKKLQETSETYPEAKKIVFIDGQLRQGGSGKSVGQIYLSKYDVTFLRYEPRIINALDKALGGSGTFMVDGFFLNKKPNPEYYKSEWWAYLREKYLKDNCEDEGCKYKITADNPLQLHHKNYQCLTFEKEKDLATLCKKHHGEAITELTNRANKYKKRAETDRWGNLFLIGSNQNEGEKDGGR